MLFLQKFSDNANDVMLPEEWENLVWGAGQMAFAFIPK